MGNGDVDKPLYNNLLLYGESERSCRRRPRFLKKNYTKLVDVKDVKPGKGIIILLPDGREVALFNVEGKIYGLDNACPHMGGPLGEGEIEDCSVICPWHGWQFDIKSGACLNMPGEDVAIIPIEVHDGEVFLLS